MQISVRNWSRWCWSATTGPSWRWPMACPWPRRLWPTPRPRSTTAHCCAASRGSTLRLRRVSLFALLACQALHSACAQPGPMRPPETSPPPRVWVVQEARKSRTGPTQSLKLGEANVSEIKGNVIFAPGTTPYGRASDPGASKYGFTIATKERALRAECSEQANDAPYFGLGKSSIDLYCTCQEGSSL